MSEEKSLIRIITTYIEYFDIILDIFKAMANDKRLLVLLAVLDLDKTFNELKRETKLQKSALSNHLVKMVNMSLIENPEHGKYRITKDGRNFIIAMENVFNSSDIKKNKEIEKTQEGQFSDSFVNYIFGNN
ncbi:MAG: ArsR family transcriptional regulator [Promethearchaeota archaeon]